MPYLFCIAYHGGSTTGIRMVKNKIQAIYPNALVVSAHYKDNGKVETQADPELLEAYMKVLEHAKSSSALADIAGSHINEESLVMLPKTEPTVLDSEEYYWQFVAWIRTQNRLTNSDVVAYIESNLTSVGADKLHPKAIHHVNQLNPGVVIFFTGTKESREQAWGWIEHNSYSQHPTLKLADFKDCSASSLTSSIIESLPIMTVAPCPLFAVVDKGKHIPSVALAIPPMPATLPSSPTLLEFFCCFKRKAGENYHTKKVTPINKLATRFSY